ncbi:NnrU family protein [Ferrovibrio sp.]|uniref:NnrU family protein n=1 Tax=Ferrovibrio sp. TaxID=1917215 RepID=UPI00260A0539|nr:NnrU family protein [Ferrovibrio sp.]
MIALALAALAWVLLHVLVAGPLRPALVGRLGLPAYRGLFSLLSAAALAALIWTYGQAPYIEFWPTTSALAAVPVVVMPVALLLLVGSLRPSNPTSAGPDMLMRSEHGELPVRGFTKITRHPMLWAFTLWAGSHLIANGDAATWLLAGSILVTALNGMPSIDRKRSAAFGDKWQRFIAKTSIFPFAAVRAGRVTLRFSDIGWLNILGAAALYAIFLWGHATLFGVPAYYP